MDWTRQLAAIAIGGAAGATARFLVAHAVHVAVGRHFPWGTLAVNALGSFLLGALYALLVERLAVGYGARGLVLIGFLGAFTTFSSFALDTVAMAEQGLMLRPLAYVLASVTVCIVLAWLGLVLVRNF